MDYGPVDSSGTDDDLPQTAYNMGTRGGVTTNGRTSIKGGLLHGRVNDDMEIQIHHLETEAYSSVLRAFKAQSDAITWEKEGLITELRKELRVSDDEHRELLNMVNADEVIQRIREWRQTGGVQSSMLSNVTNVQAAHEVIASPTISASLKKQKTSQATHSLGVSGSTLRTQAVAFPMQPFSTTARQGAPPVADSGRKFKPNLSGVTSRKSAGHHPTAPMGRCQVTDQNFSGLSTGAEPAKDCLFGSLIGRKVKTRWPEDNDFYEAVIAEFNPVEGRHALVYDRGTKAETWEWVDLKEISPNDIQWEGEDPGIFQMGREVPAGGNKKPMVPGDALQGTGKGALKNLPKKDFQMLQGENGKKRSNIQILHTDTLLKEIESFISSGEFDLVTIEKAKKTLKEHEQSLINAISCLATICDGENEEGYHPIPHGHSLDPERGWIKR